MCLKEQAFNNLLSCMEKKKKDECKQILQGSENISEVF